MNSDIEFKKARIFDEIAKGGLSLGDINKMVLEFQGWLSSELQRVRTEHPYLLGVMGSKDRTPMRKCLEVHFYMKSPVIGTVAKAWIIELPEWKAFVTEHVGIPLSHEFVEEIKKEVARGHA